MSRGGARWSAAAAAFAVACGAPASGGDVTPQPASGPAAAEGEGEDGGEAGVPAQARAVAKALNQHQAAVHDCWAVAAADDFRLSGEVVLEVEVGDGGAARRVDVVRDSSGDDVLTACLVDLWRRHAWPGAFSPGDVLRLPPLRFVAPDAQYTVRRDDAAVHEVAGGAIRARVILDEDSTGNADAALTELSVDDGSSVPVHRHPGSAEILYVREGGGTIHGAGGSDSGLEATAGHAIYVPAGAAHGFAETADGAPSELVQLYAPGGPEQRFEDTGTEGPAAVDEGAKGAAEPLVRGLPDVDPAAIAGGEAEVSILFDERSAGDDAAYVGVITGQPGLTIPRHTHESSSEYLLVLDGSGVTTVAGEELEVRPGTAVQVPPGTEHGLRVTGEAPLRALQFYTPSGPEQRFVSDRGTH